MVTVGPSDIGGTGVFADVTYAAGEVVGPFELEREITSHDTWHEHFTLIDGRVFLVAEPLRYTNHSCDPNTYQRFGEAADDPIDLVARRAIAAGEEITVDYLINNPGGDDWPCNCGAPRCRGRTTPSYFKLPELFRREYDPLLAPWFKRRYADELRPRTT